MPNSIATITFLELPNVNDSLRLIANLAVSDTPFSRGEEFKALRVNQGESTIGADLNITAQNYADAFSFDYTGFTVTVLENVVTIVCDITGDYNYFIDYEIEGTFAMVVLSEPNIVTTVTGLDGDRYLINNEINITVTSNQNPVYFKTVVQNLYNQKTSTSLISYPDNLFSADLGLQSIIKSLFEYPSDAEGYVINDQIVPNANKYKISIYYNPADADGNPTAEVLGFETVKTFIRGGKRTTLTNQTIGVTVLTPCAKLPVFRGYDTAEYYLDNVNNIRKRLLLDVPASSVVDMRPKGCNETYVKFLNQNGGYSNWLFESHSDTETNANQGGFIRDNKVDDLGNESTFTRQLESKVPKAFIQLILDLIISPEIYILIEGEFVRVRSGRNSQEYDNIKRGYPAKVNLLVPNRFNPSLLWSN